MKKNPPQPSIFTNLLHVNKIIISEEIVEICPDGELSVEHGMLSEAKSEINKYIRLVKFTSCERGQLPVL